jgi:hypothetical protein
VLTCSNLKAHAFIEREFAGAGADYAFIPIAKGERRGWSAQRIDLSSNSAVGTVLEHGTLVGPEIIHRCLDPTIVKIGRVLGE